MLTVVPGSSDDSDGRDCSGGVAAIASSESLIDETLREGARRMLAEALQA